MFIFNTKGGGVTIKGIYVFSNYALSVAVYKKKKK